MLIDDETDWREVLAAEDAAVAAAETPVVASPETQGGSIAQLIEALANGDPAQVQQG